MKYIIPSLFESVEGVVAFGLLSILRRCKDLHLCLLLLAVGVLLAALLLVPLLDLLLDLLLLSCNFNLFIRVYALCTLEFLLVLGAFIGIHRPLF